MKLKNVHTGEVVDAVSLTYDAGSVEAVRFNGREWEKLVVQKWDFVTASPETFWVPAKPGVDY